MLELEVLPEVGVRNDYLEFLLGMHFSHCVATVQALVGTVKVKRLSKQTHSTHQTSTKKFSIAGGKNPLWRERSPESGLGHGPFPRRPQTGLRRNYSEAENHPSLRSDATEAEIFRSPLQLSRSRADDRANR